MNFNGLSVSSGQISKIFPLKLFEKCLRFAKLFPIQFLLRKKMLRLSVSDLPQYSFFVKRALMSALPAADDEGRLSWLEASAKEPYSRDKMKAYLQDIDDAQVLSDRWLVDLDGHFDMFADGGKGHDAHDLDLAVEGVVGHEVDVTFVGFFPVFKDLSAVGAIIFENGHGFCAIEAAFCGEVGEKIVVGDVLAVFEVGLEDVSVEGDMFALFLGPEGETMGVFGGDVRDVGHVIMETDLGGHVLDGLELFQHASLFAGWQTEPFHKGAFRMALFAGVEQVDAVGDLVIGDAHLFEYLEELGLADVAVWAGVVGPDFNV